MSEVRRGSPAVGVVLIAMALAMAGACVWLSRDEPAVLAGLLFPVMIGSIGAWGLRHRVRLHADGVEVQDFFSRCRIRFDEADTLVYRTVGMRMSGVPVGSHVWAQLRAGRRKATFNLRCEKGQAQVLEELRSRASAAIATRALQAIHAGSPFAWGRAAVVVLEGLRYRPSGLLGRKAERTVAYTGLRYDFDAGSFSVYPPDADHALFTMKCDEPNFYPGFVLFQNLCAQA